MAAIKNPMGRLPGAERSPGRIREERPKLPKSERLRALLPEIWALVSPRHGILALGLVLMAVNRVSGLVLPASTKFLIDDVIGHRRTDLLLPLVGAVVAATARAGRHLVRPHPDPLEGGAAADRRDAPARCRPTSAGCPSPTTTRNKTGQLVSRIMNDVEGVRNLIGTGLVEFAGRPSHRRPGPRGDAPAQPGA